MPEVSVIMTFFNEPPVLLQRSIDSILHQTFQDFEFIIIAGNNENTAGIEFMKTKSAENNKIVFRAADKKLLMTTCLNMAIKMAKGEYIALQESDDASLPERLERELNFLAKNPDVDVVGTAIAYIKEEDQKLIVTRYYPASPRKAFNKFTAIAHPTILLKKELFEKYGYYNESEDVRHSPDHELWCRWIVQGARFSSLPDVLFNYYQSATNGRNRNAKKTLQSVVSLKNKYAREMNFTFPDYMYLYMEKVLLLAPQPLISKLFYLWIKIR